jgi:hypothetical protein
MTKYATSVLLFWHTIFRLSLSFQGFHFFFFVSETKEAQLVRMAVRRVAKATLKTIIKPRVGLTPI